MILQKKRDRLSYDFANDWDDPCSMIHGDLFGHLRFSFKSPTYAPNTRTAYSIHCSLGEIFIKPLIAGKSLVQCMDQKSKSKSKTMKLKVKVKVKDLSSACKRV